MKSLIDVLKEYVTEITFTKKNGEKRIMVCTLNEEYLPEISGNSREVPGLITVFDLENMGWRSFYEDSVISVEPLIRAFKETNESISRGA